VCSFTFQIYTKFLQLPINRILKILFLLQRPLHNLFLKFSLTTSGPTQWTVQYLYNRFSLTPSSDLHVNRGGLNTFAMTLLHTLAEIYPHDFCANNTLNLEYSNHQYSNFFHEFLQQTNQALLQFHRIKIFIFSYDVIFCSAGLSCSQMFQYIIMKYRYM
jgi:hypothetical protein